MRRRRKIIARQVTWQDSPFAPAMAGVMQIARVDLAAPPIAGVSRIESVINNWWMRAGGYPAGRIFGRAL